MECNTLSVSVLKVVLTNAIHSEPKRCSLNTILYRTLGVVSVALARDLCLLQHDVLFVLDTAQTPSVDIMLVVWTDDLQDFRLDMQYRQ